MSEPVMHEMFAMLRECGCRSVHIGGGEPFIDFGGLLKLVRTAKQYGIRIDYIETNAYWVDDDTSTKKRLGELLAVGTDTFCISVDPYHAQCCQVKLNAPSFCF